MNPLLLIPARYAASRLPGKPLALIAGRPMILHVLDRALAADLGPVAVATDHDGIAEAVRGAGGTVVMTRADHASGSDRILEAAERLDPGRRHDVLINVQGDLPTLDPALPRAALALLATPEVAIGTLAAPIRSAEEAAAESVVKLAGTPLDPSGRRLRALYFSRAPIPWGAAERWHHIGLYAYRRAALEAFCAWPPGALEQSERLEQLRALEHGLRIDVACVAEAPRGVDTPDDLASVRRRLESA